MVWEQSLRPVSSVTLACRCCSSNWRTGGPDQARNSAGRDLKADPAETGEVLELVYNRQNWLLKIAEVLELRHTGMQVLQQQQLEDRGPDQTRDSASRGFKADPAEIGEVLEPNLIGHIAAAAATKGHKEEDTDQTDENAGCATAPELDNIAGVLELSHTGQAGAAAATRDPRDGSDEGQAHSLIRKRILPKGIEVLETTNCVSNYILGMQALQQQLEDRGADQPKENAGRDLEAELAEIGEVLEGVEGERDALQQQVDRLEASAFQSANQAR